MYALLAAAAVIVGFVLLKPAPWFGVGMMWVGAWLGIKAHDEEDAAMARIVGWAVIAAVIYLLIP
jgi:hypothetical protein